MFKRCCHILSRSVLYTLLLFVCFNTYKFIMRNISLGIHPICMVCFLLGLGLVGCDSTTEEPDPSDLLNYVESSSLPFSDQLIACAGGGAEDVLTRPDAPVSVYFYPIEGASNFRYFETESVNVDPNNLELYQEVELEDTPFFNGYLWRFLNIPLQQEKWARVVYDTPDSLHVSNAIRLKYPVKPTLYDDAQVVVEQNGVQPSFSWPAVNDETDAIYFQVVSDRNGNLISGTYTFEKTFTFYDLSNVVLNIRDESPPPELDIDSEYTFTLMTVSRDNWVNLIAQRQFRTD